MTYTLGILGVFGIVGVVGLWFLLYRARKGGEDSMAAKVTEATAESLQKQQEAAAKSPSTKDSLVDLMRKGGL